MRVDGEGDLKVDGEGLVCLGVSYGSCWRGSCDERGGKEKLVLHHHSTSIFCV